MKKLLLLFLISCSAFAASWPEDLKNLPNYFDPKNPVELTPEEQENLELEKINEENSKNIEDNQEQEIEKTTEASLEE